MHAHPVKTARPAKQGDAGIAAVRHEEDFAQIVAHQQVEHASVPPIRQGDARAEAFGFLGGGAPVVEVALLVLLRHENRDEFGTGELWLGRRPAVRIEMKEARRVGDEEVRLAVAVEIGERHRRRHRQPGEGAALGDDRRAVGGHGQAAVAVDAVPQVVLDGAALEAGRVAQEVGGFGRGVLGGEW